MKHIFLQIKEVIIQNFSNPNFSVAMLAEILNISLSHLRDSVNRHFKMSPSRLIESLRLEKALHLLSEKHSIESVKRKVGYVHSRTFRRVFKKRLQQTPTACQEILLKNKSALKTLYKKLWNI